MCIISWSSAYKYLPSCGFKSTVTVGPYFLIVLINTYTTIILYWSFKRHLAGAYEALYCETVFGHYKINLTCINSSFHHQSNNM